MDNSNTDHQLVDRLKTGDTVALEKIIARYQSKLLAYAQRLGLDHSASQDVVQQAFINAYQNINSFNPKYKFSSWIYRIVHNLTVNSFKKKANNHLSLDFSEWIREIIPGKVDLEAEAEKLEQKKSIQKSLKKLPLKYRSVITLFYFEDKKYQEIADILHISQNTVGVRLSRAKLLLKNLLKNYGKN